MARANVEAGAAAETWAERLFELMAGWDRFDPVLHEAAEILEAARRRGLLRDLKERFELAELLSSARHYRGLLNQIIKTLEEACAEEASTNQGKPRIMSINSYDRKITFVFDRPVNLDLFSLVSRAVRQALSVKPKRADEAVKP